MRDELHEEKQWPTQTHGSNGFARTSAPCDDYPSNSGFLKERGYGADLRQSLPSSEPKAASIASHAHHLHGLQSIGDQALTDAKVPPLLRGAGRHCVIPHLPQLLFF